MTTAIIVLAQSQDHHFPNKIFFRLNAKTILEHTIDIGNRCEILNKTVVAMPYSDHSLIHGSMFKNSLVNISNSLHSIHFSFNDKEDKWQRLYKACRDYNIDNAIVIDGDCPLTMDWLIKDVYEVYHKNKLDFLYLDESFPDGCKFYICSFFYIANMIRFGQHQDLQTNFINRTNSLVISNTYNIPIFKYGYRFVNEQQSPIFETLLQQQEKGADTIEMIEDLNNEYQ